MNISEFLRSRAEKEVQGYILYPTIILAVFLFVLLFLCICIPFPAWLFPPESVLDFLSICIGLNAAGSFENIQKVFFDPEREEWQKLQDSIGVCASQEIESHNCRIANWYANEFSAGANKIMFLARISVALCIVFSIFCGSSLIMNYHFICVLFLFAPFVFVLYIGVFWVISKRFIIPALKHEKENTCNPNKCTENLEKNILGLKDQQTQK